MQPPMIGSWTIHVKAVKPFTIHGDLYYELQGVRANDATGEMIAVRVPQHATAGEPKPGETLLIKFLMGQATEARPVAGASALKPSH